MLPLAGVTVVSLEHAVAAPFATRQLADIGARVIKIERPDGGDFARGYDQALAGQSSYFVWLNRSKESVAVDVKTPDGRAILDELVARADVVVSNLGPGAAARLGVDADHIRGSDPTKIVLAITGWGSTGPWSYRKAYDLLIQCETGLVSLTGSGAEAARVGISIADIAAGMYGFAGILTALYQRAVTGRGEALEVSLFEALAEWMGQPANYTAGTGTQPPRAGAHHATIAPYGPYTTRDGYTVLVAVQNDAEWRRFCTDILARPSLTEDQRFQSNTLRVANRFALNGIITDRLAALDAAHLVTLLDDAGIARAGVNTLTDFIHHPVLEQRGRWRPVRTPSGTVTSLLPPIATWGEEVRMDPVPSLGEHTAAVLRELGLSVARISTLRAKSIIHTPTDR
jgi:itaconate CoA-transferase